MFNSFHRRQSAVEWLTAHAGHNNTTVIFIFQKMPCIRSNSNKIILQEALIMTLYVMSGLLIAVNFSANSPEICLPAVCHPPLN